MNEITSSIFIASAVNMIDAGGISIGFYPFPSVEIPDRKKSLAFSSSAHNVTILNCTLNVQETEVEIDIVTKALTPTLSPSDAATQRLLSPLMLTPDLKVTDFLRANGGVAQIL